jgi:hypothetical protein
MYLSLLGSSQQLLLSSPASHYRLKDNIQSTNHFPAALGGSHPPSLRPLRVLLYPPQRDESPATPPHISIERQRRRCAFDQDFNRWGGLKKRTCRGELRFPARDRITGTAL